MADDDARSKPVQQQVTEIWELVVAYAKQETVDPLKNVGRYLAWGLAGAFLIGVGSVYLTLAVLRFLQHDTDTHFRDHLSWLPYAITIAALLGVAVLVWGARGLRSTRKARKQDQTP
ncbi:MAG: phage holin family protein [Acidimicrobiia bacterium]